MYDYLQALVRTTYNVVEGAVQGETDYVTAVGSNALNVTQDAAGNVIDTSIDYVVDAAQRGAAEVHDYATTARTDMLAGLALAAQAQAQALAAGHALARFQDETHGVMAAVPAEPNLAASYYRLGYWLAIGGRVALGRGDHAAAQVLGEAAATQIGRGNRSVAATLADALPFVPRRLAPAGRATVAGLWLLGRTDLPEIRQIVRHVNAAAVRAFTTRLAIVATVGAVAVGSTAYLATRRGRGRGRVRTNGRRPLTQAQRARLLKGVGLLIAGAGLISPLDEAILAVLTAGLGIPITPLQGGATVVGGVVLMGAGAYLATTPRKVRA